MRTGYEVSDIIEIPAWHQIHLPPQLIHRAWHWPLQLVQNGSVPPIK